MKIAFLIIVLFTTTCYEANSIPTNSTIDISGIAAGVASSAFTYGLGSYAIKHHGDKNYKYNPLLKAFSAIAGFALGRAGANMQMSVEAIMSDLMAAFYIIFGAPKILSLKKFVACYQSYDLLASNSSFYAYAYPFLELLLGALYLVRFTPIFIHCISFLLSLEALTSVLTYMAATKPCCRSQCACLGALAKIPVGKVTLAENAVMALMALAMTTRR